MAEGVLVFLIMEAINLLMVLEEAPISILIT